MAKTLSSASGPGKPNRVKLSYKDQRRLAELETMTGELPDKIAALETGLADVVLLDNMDIATLSEAVKLANGRVVLEASGGVTQASIAKIAATGVDYASAGALTHSAPNFDIALDIDA